MASSATASDPQRGPSPLPWLALLLVLGGCCRVDPGLQGPPAITVHLLHDGFHSSLLVPNQLGMRTSEWQDLAPWIEIGFSDLAWTVDGVESTRHASRLGLIPDEGAVEFGLVPTPESLLDHPTIEAHRAIVLSAAGWAALRERLQWWVESDGPVVGVIDGRSYIPARRSFSAYNSCNDFCADLLKAGGLPICPRPWRTASGLMAQVAAAEAERQRWREGAE